MTRSGRRPATPSTPGAAALVTGGTSGIGAAFARELERRGFEVTVVARRASAGQLAADLSEDAGCAMVVDWIGRHRPEVVVLAAGQPVPAAFPASELEHELALVDVQIRATLRLVSAALGPMLEARRGWIVTVGSTAGLWSDGTYSAAKSWLARFTTGLAQQLGDSGVVSTCVAPGFTSTPYFAGSGFEVAQRGGWWLEPDRVAAVGLAGAARAESLVVPGGRYRVLVPLITRLPAGLRRRAIAAMARAAGLSAPPTPTPRRRPR